MTNVGHAVPADVGKHSTCCLDVLSSFSRPNTPYGRLAFLPVDEVLPKSVGDEIVAGLFEEDPIMHFIWDCLTNNEDVTVGVSH